MTISEDKTEGIMQQESLFEDKALMQDSSSEDEEMEEVNPVSQKDSLYRFVGHQSKVCMRKGLAIVKQLYEKYSNIPAYIESYSG